MGQTVFSTLTVNRWDATHDARTRLHRDKGNLAGSFAVISALRLGVVGRAYLVFPKFEVAVHLNDRDVLIADVNEFHGNVKMFYLGPAERISTIAYFHSSNLD